MKSFFATLALAGLIAGPALADTIVISPLPVNGTMTGNLHTVTIDRASCKVKSSSGVSGASQGCNYAMTANGDVTQTSGWSWTVVPQQQNGCSTACE